MLTSYRPTFETLEDRASAGTMLMPSVSFLGLNDLLLDEDCGPLSVVLSPRSTDGVGDDARALAPGGHAAGPSVLDRLAERRSPFGEWLSAAAGTGPDGSVDDWFGHSAKDMLFGSPLYSDLGLDVLEEELPLA
jgi:hypothetical protein